MKPSTLNLFIYIFCMLITAFLVVAEAKADDLNEESSARGSSNKSESSDQMSECFIEAEGKKKFDHLSECVSGFSQYMNKDPASIKVNASYALGVRFYQDVVENYQYLDFAQFLLGSIEAAGENSRFREADLDKVLSAEILSTKDKSDKFVKEFALKAGVEQFKGIYYIDRTEPVNSLSESNCIMSTDNQSHSFEFTRLELEMNLVGLVIPSGSCITLSEKEMIRGWRTALNKMKSGEVWQVLIPASHAYGDEGIKSDIKKNNVESGEALHFLIRQGSE